MNKVFTPILLMTVFSMAALLPACCAVPSLPQPAGVKAMPAPPEDISQQLQLTPEQQKKIDAIENKAQHDIRLFLPAINAKTEKLDALIADPKSSDQAIAKAVADLAHVQVQIKLVQIYAQRSIEKLYTPQQQALLKAARLKAEKSEKVPPPNCAHNGCGGSPDPNGCGCGDSCTGNCN